MNSLTRNKKNNRRVVEKFSILGIRWYVWIIVAAMFYACVEHIDCSFLYFWTYFSNYQ